MSKIRLYGATSGYIELAAPAVADDATLVLPTGADGFASEAYVDTEIATAIAGVGPLGKVLQVVSTTKQDVFTTTSTSYTDVTGLSVSITPSSATSKVLVIVSLSFAGTSANANRAQIVRDATAIGGGTASGNRPSASFFDRNYELDGGSATHAPFSHNYLDSPATTSAVTYKAQVACDSGTLVVNRTWTDADTTYWPRLASSITLMEVAG